MLSKPFSRSRRVALSHFGTAAVGGASIMLPSTIQATTSADRITEELLLQLGKIGNFASIQLIDLPISLKLKPGFTRVEQDIRSQMLDVLPQTEEFNLPLLWQHEQVSLAKKMQEFHVRTTKYVADVVRDPGEIRVEESKTCGEVLVRVLLETFGIDQSVRKKVTDFLTKRELYALAKEIGRAAKGKNWLKATMLLRKFFVLLTTEETLILFEQAIGKKAFKKFLGTVASRFVPWLGWGLIAASFATSLYANLDRLQECKW